MLPPDWPGWSTEQLLGFDAASFDEPAGQKRGRSSREDSTEEDRGSTKRQKQQLESEVQDFDNWQPLLMPLEAPPPELSGEVLRRSSTKDQEEQYKTITTRENERYEDEPVSTRKKRGRSSFEEANDLSLTSTKRQKMPLDKRLASKAAYAQAQEASFGQVNVPTTNNGDAGVFTYPDPTTNNGDVGALTYLDPTTNNGNAGDLTYSDPTTNNGYAGVLTSQVSTPTTDPGNADAEIVKNETRWTPEYGLEVEIGGSWLLATEHPDYVSRLDFQANNTKNYVHKRATGPGVGNFTAYLESQHSWGGERENRPDILFAYKIPNGHWNASQPGLIIYHDNGEDRVVVDVINHRPLKAFPNLPITISKNVEGWLMETWQRQDKSIQLEDYIQRMPFTANDDVWKNRGKKFSNALTQRKDRFRNRARCLAWKMKQHNRKHDQRLAADMMANKNWLNANTTRYLNDLTVDEDKALQAANVISEQHMKKAGRQQLQGDAKAAKRAKMRNLLKEAKMDDQAPVSPVENLQESERRPENRVHKVDQPQILGPAKQSNASHQARLGMQASHNAAQEQAVTRSATLPPSENLSEETFAALLRSSVGCENLQGLTNNNQAYAQTNQYTAPLSSAPANDARQPLHRGPRDSFEQLQGQQSSGPYGVERASSKTYQATLASVHPDVQGYSESSSKQPRHEYPPPQHLMASSETVSSNLYQPTPAPKNLGAQAYLMARSKQQSPDHPQPQYPVASNKTVSSNLYQSAPASANPGRQGYSNPSSEQSAPAYSPPKVPMTPKVASMNLNQSTPASRNPGGQRHSKPSSKQSAPEHRPSQFPKAQNVASMNGYQPTPASIKLDVRGRSNSSSGRSASAYPPTKTPITVNEMALTNSYPDSSYQMGTVRPSYEVGHPSTMSGTIATEMPSQDDFNYRNETSARLRRNQQHVSNTSFLPQQTRYVQPAQTYYPSLAHDGSSQSQCQMYGSTTQHYGADQLLNNSLQNSNTTHSPLTGYQPASYDPFTHVEPTKQIRQTDAYPQQQYNRQPTQSPPSAGDVPRLSPSENTAAESYGDPNLPPTPEFDELWYNGMAFSEEDLAFLEMDPEFAKKMKALLDA